jgi:hypothetical protein
MRVLVVPQSSQISQAISQGRKEISPAVLVWEDTGLPVEFPILLSNTRKRKYIPGVYTYDYTFDDLCKLFPELVIDMEELDYMSGYPSWGSGWYAEGVDGFAYCFKENWDSSD